MIVLRNDCEGFKDINMGKLREGWTVDVVVEFFKGLLGDNK